MERISLYAYHNWQVAEPFLLTAGVSYDRLTFPVNFLSPPLVKEEATTDRVSPKAGFIWTPTRDTTLRFGYSRSLGGVVFDQSFRLEPVQVAGFNQAFRSLIPESETGSISAERFETFGLSFEQKFGTRTYVGLGGEILQSKADQVLGTYDLDVVTPITGSSFQIHHDFVERSIFLSAYQLVGGEWSLGARYRLSQAQLKDRFEGFSPVFPSQVDLEAVLHRVDLFARYNHPSGFFGAAQGIWHRQNSQGYLPALASEDVWQFNLFAGYRFARRHAEVHLGLLNITDQDYRLNPLNLHPDLPRERTVLTSLRFYF